MKYCFSKKSNNSSNPNNQELDLGMKKDDIHVD